MKRYELMLHAWDGTYSLIRFPCPSCRFPLEFHSFRAGTRLNCGVCGKSMIVPSGPLQPRQFNAGKVRSLIVEAVGGDSRFNFGFKAQAAWQRSCPILDGECFAGVKLQSPVTRRPEWTYSEAQTLRVVAGLAARAQGRHYGKGLCQDGVVREGWWTDRERTRTSLQVGDRRPCRETLRWWCDPEIGCPHLGWLDKRQRKLRFIFQKIETDFIGLGGKKRWHLEESYLPALASLKRRGTGVYGPDLVHLAGAMQATGLPARVIYRLAGSGKIAVEELPNVGGPGSSRRVYNVRRLMA